MRNSLVDVIGEKAEALVGALKKHFRVGSEFRNVRSKTLFLYSGCSCHAGVGPNAH
jgi:hypothetical protein